MDKALLSSILKDLKEARDSIIQVRGMKRVSMLKTADEKLLKAENKVDKALRILSFFAENKKED